MCGIWAYFLKKGSENDTNIDIDLLFSKFKTISGRGPDNLNFNYYKNLFFLGFHRLSIMDTSSNGNQPFTYIFENKTYICVCNGEIYNSEFLKEEVEKSYLNYEWVSSSDCEVLIPLYILYGPHMVNKLRGVFAINITIIDCENNYSTFICRDRIGVRPLFIGHNFNNNSMGISSEAKGLIGIFNQVSVFRPGCHVIYNNTTGITEPYYTYYNYEYKLANKLIQDNRIEYVRESFIKAVEKRLISDRPVCALLSGGLDSSLVCSVASSLLKKNDIKLYTYSIGMKNSTDEIYAKKVAKFINSEHTVVNITNEQALMAIKDVIWATETYDITTIRASTGQYLICKYISENSNFKVVLSGDGSDEVASGYIYNYLAPSEEALHQEAVKRVKEIHLYDGLRADRATSIHGLELRVPFLDSEFVDLYLSLDPKYRKPNEDQMEKHLLRSAFHDYLPQEVLWRKKEAFSDGISSEEESWHTVINNYIDKFITNEEFDKNASKFTHCTPKTKEAYFYRKIFDEFFGDNHCTLIPDYWMPNWSNVNDPSARELKNLYKVNKKIQSI